MSSSEDEHVVYDSTVPCEFFSLSFFALGSNKLHNHLPKFGDIVPFLLMPNLARDQGLEEGEDY